MSNSDRLFSPASYIGLTILNVLFIFVMLSEPLGDAAESLMIKMAAPFQAKYLYDNPDNLLAYDFQTRSSEYWDKEKILLLTLDDLEVQNTGKPYPFNYAKYAEDIRMAHQLEAKAQEKLADLATHSQITDEALLDKKRAVIEAALARARAKRSSV